MDAGWYGDPNGGGGQRYWDGMQWTENVTVPPGPPGFQPAPAMVVPKSPGISLLVSFFIPGVGSLMNGDTNTGVIILVGSLVSLFLMCFLVGFITYIGFWIWGMVDAYQGAQRWNLRHGFVS
jgi:TM2 domain-containing membrane protein YozV